MTPQELLGSQQRLPAPDLTAAPRLLGTDWLLLGPGGRLSAEGGALFLSASVHHGHPCERDLGSALRGPLARSVECSPCPRPTVPGLVLPPKPGRVGFHCCGGDGRAVVGMKKSHLFSERRSRVLGPVGSGRSGRTGCISSRGQVSLAPTEDLRVGR